MLISILTSKQLHTFGIQAIVILVNDDYTLGVVDLVQFAKATLVTKYQPLVRRFKTFQSHQVKSNRIFHSF